MSPRERLRFHVTGAIERGEAVAITEQRAAPVWEMYEAQTFIGIRNARTLRCVARVPLGATDFDTARTIAAAPTVAEEAHKLVAALQAMPGVHPSHYEALRAALAASGAA